MRKIALFILIICLHNTAFGQDGRMIDQIRGQKGGTSVWWAGQDSWIIKSGDLVIATDLFLENSGRIAPAPITPEEVASVIDIEFITHSHGDHFEEYTSKILNEKSSCLFVMPESCLEEAKRINIAENRIIVARPRVPFEVKGIKVSPLRAIHGNANFAIYYDANILDCGYLLTIGGKTFLQPGDTYLLEDHLFIKKVDVLFFSPTEHNMYIDPSVILINALDPEFIFPQHHSTVAVNDENRFWAKGYPDEVKIRLSQSLKNRYHILKPGDKMVIIPDTRYTFLGASACALKCHNNNENGFQYSKWKKSLHSESYNDLGTKKALRYCKEAGINENPQQSAICLQCHTTARGVDPASLSNTYRMEDGVTCEACHKGEFITKTFLPDEADCLKCHNNSVHKVSSFNFKEKCAKISHPRLKTKPDSDSLLQGRQAKF